MGRLVPMPRMLEYEQTFNPFRDDLSMTRLKHIKGWVDVPPASGGGSEPGPPPLLGHARATTAIATSAATVSSIERLRVIDTEEGAIGGPGYRGPPGSPCRSDPSVE